MSEPGAPIERSLGDRFPTISSRRQVISGLAIGVVVISGWLLWNTWGRAAALALLLAMALPMFLLFRFPLLGAVVLGFAITSNIDAFIPRTFTLSLVVTLTIVAFQKCYQDDFQWKIPPFVAWSLLLFVWSFTSLLWTPNYDLQYVQMYVYTTLLMLLVPELIQTPSHFKVFLGAIGLGILFSTVSSVFGVYTLFSSGLAVIAAGSAKGLESARYFGHWSGPNVLAHSLLPFIILYLPFLRKSEPIWLRWLFGFVVAGGAIAVGLSLSRAAILSLAIAFAMVISSLKRRWLFALIAVFIITATPLILPVNVMGRIASLSHGGHDSSVRQRSEIAKAAIRMIEDYFPFGVGMGGFYFRQLDYNPHPYKVDHCHNTYLQILADSGLIGECLFILTLLSVIIPLQAHVTFSIKSLDGQLKVALIATFVGLLVSMLFENKIAWPNYWLAFLLMSIFPTVYNRKNTRTHLKNI